MRIKYLILLLTVLIISSMVTNVQAQWNSEPEKLDHGMGMSAMFDDRGTAGLGIYFGKWMLEYMFKMEFQGDTDIDYNNYKLGRAFPLLRTSSMNFSLYGMGGYASYKEDSGSSEEEASGMLIEVGGLLGFKVIGLGAGYVALDEAYEAEYLNFRLTIFMF